METISYNDIIPFVFKYLKKRSAIIYLSILISIMAFSWMVVCRANLIGLSSLTEVLPYTVLGFIIIPLLLIIPHELLHVLPYYLYGARDIRIGKDLSQYYFYVTAHNFPISSISFTLIAITPFVVISALLVYLSITLNPLWQWSISISLFLHTTMCAGDIALINFCFVNRSEKIYTWDDTERKESYFYRVHSN